MIEEFILEDNLSIKSNLTTLKEITENKIFYSIPIYQRLYVWGDDQVITLLEDLNRASKNMDKNYYLGGIMVTQNNNNFDLIDGQQRFTTLWLLSYELKEELEQFVYSIEGLEKKKRLSFAIRDFANHYFENPELFSILKEEEKIQLNNICAAQKTIKSFLNDKTIKVDRIKLAKYVYSNVAFIKTEMPQNIDENRLFEVLNNRGVQLQHHEILKAKFIEQISDEDKTQYAQLWDACSIMNEYVEKNIKEVCGFKWSDLTFRDTDGDQEVGLPLNILERISSNIEDLDRLHLSDVLQIENLQTKVTEDDLEYDSGKVRSIISFPMFLLHSLRIFIYQKEGKDSDNIVEVNEKKLLEIFQNSFFENYLNSIDTKQFIELIWKLRIKFDKYVIKWVEIEGEEHHIIKRLYLNKKTLQRRTPVSNEGFALLQSMLYHSQQIITHYWLTPFMFNMLTSDSFEDLYVYLRKLDNKMFCSGSNQDLKTRSWNLINDDLLEFKPNIILLDESNGTDYWSYWFYKLEFILWYRLSDSKGEDWKNYRATKKNSVEHISPQHPKDYDSNKVWNDDDDKEIKTKKLNDFGNLVLLSVGMNSEYSNKTFNEKRTTFREKKRLDSLKSALIFENDIWNWELCEQHRKEMINYFYNYFIDSHK